MTRKLTLRGSTPNSYMLVKTNGVFYNKSYLANSDWSLRQMYNGKVLRFEVRSGDVGRQGDQANHNERSEVVTADFRGFQTAYRLYSGVDYWLSNAFMIEPGDPIIASYSICGQTHDIADPADIAMSPPFNFVLGQSVGDEVPITIQTRSDPNPISPTVPNPVVRWSGTLTRGVYTNFVTRIRMDPFGAGQLQFWQDGVEQINLSNIAMGYNNPEDQAYWQIGIYRHENENTLAVRYANVEQGPTTLFARVANPLSVPPYPDVL